jgi:ABC-type sugar transport system ATPase subunit
MTADSAFAPAVSLGRAVLELEGVSRSFPGAKALTDVSISVDAGEIRALLGENGAGKSTLIKIVTGAIAADTGVVRVGGEVLKRANPRTAQRLGVRAIHQERQIAGDLTVAENVYLEAPPRNSAGFATRHAAIRQASRLLADLHIDLDPGANAGILTAAEQQLIELARAVSARAKVVIMDEPTASLHPDEVATLFRVVRRLEADGTAVLYVSHHLDEVFEIADSATVLRNGAHVADVAIRARGPEAEQHKTDAPLTTREQLVSLMFGRDVSRTRLERVVTTPTPAIVATGISFGRALKPVDVTVNYGEVLALSGASGAGSSELAALLAGVETPSSGSIRMVERNKAVKGRDRAVEAGIAYLPANRKRDGLLLERSISENLLLVPKHGLGDVLYWPPTGRRLSRQAVADGNVKAGDVSNRVMTLSGGNQQKVILARWMLAGSRVLVLDEPTAGIDVASKFEIYRRLLDLAGEGFAVVIVSSDYEEIACLADRVLLMRDGAITAELAGAESTAEELYQREMAGAA